MEITDTEIPAVKLIKPKVFGDERGFFYESYRKHLFVEHDLEIDFVQDNVSLSKRGTIRGLHYQIENQQDKLVMVMKGRILDVAVDLRKQSPTFGAYTSRVLSVENKHQLFIPKGFAHGFSTLSDEALVYYKCSDYYNPDAERGLSWNDQDLNINWQVEEPVISGKDQNQPRLKEIPNEDLF